MNARINRDRLSVLPNVVKDSILTCLTIKEAVRTSILSQRWRYQWHSLSKININCDDLLGVSKEKFVKIIDHVLFFHHGSLIDSFKLDIHFNISTDINRWILYLSRHGIKALILKSSDCHYHNLSICLLPCGELTHLELSWFRFKSPATFKEFSNMRELLFDHVIIDNEALEKLINSCPLLCRLSLLNDYYSSPIRIDAPELVLLHVSNCNWNFPLSMNTPLLESALFGSQPVSNHQNCFVLFCSLPLLQRLELNHFAMQELASGDIPARLPIVCPIKHLILWINSENMNEMAAAFCLFKSSPFMRMLDITLAVNRANVSLDEVIMGSPSISAEAFWKGEQEFSFKFDNLQEVKLTDFSGTEYELKFIEFLLANGSALETVVIKFRNGCKNVVDWFSIITKLTSFPLASPKAKLILPSEIKIF